MSVDIIYGSQTGNSEEISKTLYTNLLDEGFTVNKCVSMNQYLKEDEELKKFLKDPKIIILITSSTGAGDPPDNASKFKRALRALVKKEKQESTKPLKHIYYTVLGLGDSNYTDFGAIPTYFEESFRKLGANCFRKFTLADDGTGLEVTIEPWMETIGNDVEQAVTKLTQPSNIKTPLQDNISTKPKEEEGKEKELNKADNNPSTEKSQTKMIVPKLRKCRIKLEPSLSKDTTKLSKNYILDRFISSIDKNSNDYGYTSNMPFNAKIKNWKYLTTKESKDRIIINIDLEISKNEPLKRHKNKAANKACFNAGDSIEYIVLIIMNIL